MSIPVEDIAAVKPDCLAGAAIEAKAEVVAQGKAGMRPMPTFLLAMLAGAFIGCGALFMTFVKSDAALPFAASQVLGGLCFSLGLICVVVAGAELFTGNVLMTCAAMSGTVRWSDVLRNWGIVWLGNLVGSLALVAVIACAGSAGMNGGAVGDAMVSVAAGKMALPPEQIVARGIMCNFLVCLAVWMGFAGRTVIDKIFTCVFPVMAFVAMGFEHCVANMFFLPMGLAAAGAGFGAQVAAGVSVAGAAYNIALATVGNIIGGAVCVGLVYWFAYRKKA